MSVNTEFTDISLLHASENGYSEVYKAQRLGKWHVLKRLTPDEELNPRYQELLRKEFEISFTLSHPNIVQTISMEDVNGLGICIIQEYIDGVTWDEYFLKNKVSDAECRRILSELCDAVAYIHSRQIIHRDIKPQNILITRDGHHPRLIDFGLADRDVYTILKEPAGTTGYASPEQQKVGILDNRSDIYSLGVLIEALPYSFRRIARRCLINDPTKRPVSALDIKRQLQPTHTLRWVALAVLAIVSGFAMAWIFKPEVTTTIDHAVVDSLTQKTETQQQRILQLNSQVAALNTSLDSAREAAKVLDQKITEEDTYNKNIVAARQDIRDRVDLELARAMKKHAGLSNNPEQQKSTARLDVYALDWQSILTAIMKKYHLDTDSHAVSIKKILYDEYIFYMAEK